jgi:PAS domain S-box-containing protein
LCFSKEIFWCSIGKESKFLILCEEFILLYEESVATGEESFPTHEEIIMDLLNTTEGNSLSIDSLLSGLGAVVLKSISDPFDIISNDFRIIWMNERMGKIYQTNPDEAIGNICYQFFFNEKEPCKNCIINEVKKTGRAVIAEKWKNIPDGTRKFVEIRSYPVRGNNNEIAAIIVIYIDATRRKEELQKQKNCSDMLKKKLLGKNVLQDDMSNNENSILPKDHLSDRELEVLRFVTEGFTNTQISNMLEISKHTVKSHVINIFNKLGVNDRTQAAVIAVRDKII